jgi:hypothetical protein
LYAQRMELTFAAIGLLLCLALLVRLAIRPHQRAMLDRRVLGLRDALLRKVQGLRGRVAQRRLARRAGQEARLAIERARRNPTRVDREGNVYRPRSFKGKPGADRKDH